MKTTQEKIAVMAHHVAGGVVEYKSHMTDVPCPWLTTSAPDWDWVTCDYRIKAQPKLRPWKPEEVPLPCVLRPSGNSAARWLALSASSSGVSSANCHHHGDTAVATFDVLLRFNEHSTDGGKTWKPCGVIEE